jgi:NAD(P)-dependent dehydrogenase (short-subunit alcohol dehydrogenase family)
MRVVISGANRGLGLALASAMASVGHEVIGGCRSPKDATDLAAVATDVFPLDMESEASIAEFGAAVVAGGAVDVLINNAGLDAGAFGVASSDRDVLTLSVDHFNRQMTVNAVGPMLLTRALVPALGQGSKIVNVTSQIGSMVVAQRIGRDIGYAASKAALNMITVKLAVRLKDDGVTVVALHPGYLRTDMGGAGADLDPVATAAQIAGLIDGWTLADTGKFYRWDGSEHPW